MLNQNQMLNIFQPRRSNSNSEYGETIKHAHVTHSNIKHVCGKELVEGQTVTSKLQSSHVSPIIAPILGLLVITSTARFVSTIERRRNAVIYASSVPMYTRFRCLYPWIALVAALCVHKGNAFAPYPTLQLQPRGHRLGPKSLALRSSQTLTALDFESGTLLPNTITPVRWQSTGERVSPHSYRMGLDPELTETLLEFCDETGITKTFWSLLVNDSPLVPGSFAKTRLRDHDWYIQRPGLKWASNTHWISPFDERTHIEFLKVLSKGGFDKVLDCIGKKFGFDGLVAYHLSFIGVSHCTKGYMHNDITDVAGKGFNLIIPLMLATDSGPELELEQWDNQAIIGRYKYKLNEANMVGDSVAHATAACDYLAQGEMRMAATVYIADVNSENVEQVAAYFTQKYPPQDDSQHLLDRAGSHWQKDDPTTRLPTRVEPLLF